MEPSAASLQSAACFFQQSKLARTEGLSLDASRARSVVGLGVGEGSATSCTVVTLVGAAGGGGGTGAYTPPPIPAPEPEATCTLWDAAGGATILRMTNAPFTLPAISFCPDMVTPALGAYRRRS